MRCFSRPAVSDSVAEIDAKIAANATLIAELDAKIAANATLIAELDAKIASNATLIAELDAKIASNATSIAELDAKIAVDLPPLPVLRDLGVLEVARGSWSRPVPAKKPRWRL